LAGSVDSEDDSEQENAIMYTILWDSIVRSREIRAGIFREKTGRLWEAAGQYPSDFQCSTDLIAVFKTRVYFRAGSFDGRQCVIDELERPNQYVIGGLKSAGRSLFEERCRVAPIQRLRKSESVEIQAEVWARLDPEVIEAGWALSEDESGEIDDDEEEEDPT
jgi:hypothetical protein